jgi:CheY-like chemotaxis protein
MTAARSPAIILLADDDADDRMLVRDSLAACAMAHALRSVEDGEALLDYLRSTASYSASGQTLRPRMILLDLNMPKKDGREALKELKADPNLRDIPVVILTTSDAVEEMERCYDLGASSFLVKPVTYNGWIALMQGLVKSWLNDVQTAEAADRD